MKDKKTTSTIALEELKRRDDLESLRKFLTIEQCFPAHKDSLTCPITMEELKKLARAWKLNEQRNFWKNHAEKDDMVAVLLEYANNNEELKIHIVPKIPGSPKPPIDLKPSGKLVRDIGNYKTSFKNYFGLKHFNREVSSTELVNGSRCFVFPDEQTHLENLVTTWRNEDFHMKDTTVNPSMAAVNTRSASVTSVSMRHGSNMRNKAKVIKHRNLAGHLLNYSANPDLNKSALTIKEVQTFINVAETDDSKTVSNCVIALSNISASSHVRLLLFEINAVHKFANLMGFVKGQQASWAASLLFYYFSCDMETEDRVYNSCNSLLQTNSTSKDYETRIVTLYTLNNLLPCIDRQRLVEVIMRIIHAHFEPSMIVHDKALIHIYINILQNTAAFSNTHATLMNLSMIVLLGQIAYQAAEENNSELGLGIVKILHCFLQLPEQAGNLINMDYINVLISLLHIHHDSVILQCMKAATIISSLASVKVIIIQSELVSVISRLIIKRGDDLSSNLCKEFSKFYLHLTIVKPDPKIDPRLWGGDFDGVLESFVTQNKVFDAVLCLLKSPVGSNTTTGVSSAALLMKRNAMTALQNLLSVASNCIRLAPFCCTPIIKLLRDHNELAGIYSLYNISCVLECRSKMVEKQIHIKMLEFMCAAKELPVKSANLQVLVQMSSSNICVMELLKLDLITKLEAQIRGGINKDIWRDISLMLLAVVAYAVQDLTLIDQISITRILQSICNKGTSEDVIENCASVLRYISVKFDDYGELNPVVRSILQISDAENVLESMSTTMYNMTCTTANIELMLKDDQYVNIMIRIMRSAKLEVQENIARSMRTLCSSPKCTKILLENDILSDLIVIALLRTSSEEIKVVCGEAFYNMLCHPDTQLQLLQGDLWWALMRLCRSDSLRVRLNAVRSLFFLSCDPNNIQALRNHHILSFVKYINLISGNGEGSGFTDSIITWSMKSVNNIVGQFENLVFTQHEVICSIRIGADILIRCKNIDTIRDALLLLLRCAQHQVDGASAEFQHAEIFHTLENSSKLWTIDDSCREHVASLVWELSKSPIITKTYTLLDIDAVLNATLVHTVREKLLEISDHVASTILQFLVREHIPIDTVPKMNVWSGLLHDTFGTSSPLISIVAEAADLVTAPPALPANMNVNVESNRSSPLLMARQTIVGGNSSGKTSPVPPPLGETDTSFKRSSILIDGGGSPLAQRLSKPVRVVTQAAALFANLKTTMIGILSFCIEEMTHKYTQKLNRQLVSGLLNMEMLEFLPFRGNLLVVIQSLSKSATLTNFLIEADIFRLLKNYLEFSIGGRTADKAKEYCANFLRNISLHTTCVMKYINVSDGSLNGLIRELLENSNNKVADDVALDISIMFLNSAPNLGRSDTALNPKFVLEMISKMTNIEVNDRDTDLALINKYTISTIMNKYTFGSGVEPSYIQSMFNYISKNQNQGLPECIENVHFKEILEHQEAHVYPEILKNKKSTVVTFRSFEADSSIWMPIIHNTRAESENIILKFSRPVSLRYEKVDVVEPNYSSASMFSKIVRTYETVRESVVKSDIEGNNQAIVEGDGDDDDDDDEDEDGDEDGYDDELEESKGDKHIGKFSNHSKHGSTTDENRGNSGVGSRQPSAFGKVKSNSIKGNSMVSKAPGSAPSGNGPHGMDMDLTYVDTMDEFDGGAVTVMFDQGKDLGINLGPLQVNDGNFTGSNEDFSPSARSKGSPKSPKRGKNKSPGK